MKKLFFILSVVAFASCNTGNKFRVEGTIEGGAGKTIYLEHTGLMKTTVLDSVKIKDNGDFSFKADRPEYPDFYKLTLDKKQIYFAVDSTETLQLTASADSFPTGYTIQGSSSNNDIQTLRKSAANIQQKANEAFKGMDSEKRQELETELLAMIEAHKAIARPIILKNPGSTAAYFAIFQKVNNMYIFSPYDKADRPYYAAVATSYHTFMPEYDRSKNLYGLVMDAIKTERQARQQESLRQMIEEAGTGYIDIELPDRNGRLQKLSSLQGKVILLDFSAYQAEESVQYTFALRDLYNSYSNKGFEIYQVSLDPGKLLWQDAVKNIPWISVRDENGPNTLTARSYNISTLPTYFLIDRQGNITGKNMDFSTLRREIEKLL